MRRTLLLLVLSQAALATSLQAQSLLVVNQVDATVSVLDPATGKEVATIAEHTPGVHGHEIAVTLDGKTAFLPIYGSVGVGKPGIDGHEMLVIDVPSRKIVDHVEFGHGVRPHMPLLDPATGNLYVTTELDKTISIIDPHTHKITGTIPTGAEQSHMLILSHDGKRGYTANVGPGTVSVLDMAAHKTIEIIPVAPQVQRIAISNDDHWVFTSDVTKPQLLVIDTSTNKIARSIHLPGFGYGARPTADGKQLLIAIPTKNQVAVIDLAKMEVVRTIDVVPDPQEIIIRPDNKVAYVSSPVGAEIGAIDLTTWQTSTMKAGAGADGLIWAK